MKAASGRILVVDRDRLFAARVRAALAVTGLDVEATSRASAAIRRLADAAFDVVIVDDDLPDMKGRYAVDVFKDVCPSASIIMTSAQNTRELEASILGKDVFFYYVKGFSLTELLEAVRSALERPVGRPSAGAAEAPPEILLVDDDRGFVAAVSSLLARRAWHVRAAYSKKEALEQLRREKPDLVILDIMLEEISDGFELCKKLRYDPDLSSVAVIVVSSVSEKTGLTFPTVSGGDPTGADCYLEKPVKFSELLRRVEAVLCSKFASR